MKRLLVLAAIGALLFPDVALAQPGNDNRPGGNRPGDQGQGNRPDRPGPNRPGGPVTLPAKPPGDRPGPGNKPGRPDRPNPPGPGMRPPPRPQPPGLRPPPRPRPPQFSWRGRYFAQIRGSMFRYPPGYAYRRWTIGQFLPGLFLSSSYYYDDWRGVGLDSPPPGRRWVRYGSDLLLVNLRTRRIEDVIPGAFY